MNALDLIHQDHVKLRQMFGRAMATEDPTGRETLLHQIRAELMAHEKMEEDVFYPALRTGGEKAKAVVLEGYEAHHVIDVILDELLGVPEDAEQWNAKLKILNENFEHHIEEEESEMFKRAQEALDEQTLEELGQKMADVKTAAQA